MSSLEQLAAAASRLSRLPSDLVAWLEIAEALSSAGHREDAADAYAGLGAAALLRVVPVRVRGYLAAALIFVAFADTLRPAVLGLKPPVVYEAFRIRPRSQVLEFFEELEKRHNTGPLLEVPFKNRYVMNYSVLVSAYHHRHTSACRSFFEAQAMSELQQLSERLPEATAITAAREMGFTTILLSPSLIV